MGIISFTRYSVNAQINIEAIARLHSAIENDKGMWHNGFGSIISGSFSPYQSHRSVNNRDSAYVARTAGGEAQIEWRTSAVDKKSKTGSETFIWCCGFGNNLGEEWFDLQINDNISIPFSTQNAPYWKIEKENGIVLSFTAAAVNSNGANLGYMTLTVPSSLLNNSTLKLGIKGRTSDREVWYRLYTCSNVLQYISKNEIKQFYTDIEFIHMGDAKLKICAKNKFDDFPINIFTSGKLTAEGRLNKDGLIAKTEIYIPRHIQPLKNDISFINIADKRIDTISWKEINERRIREFMNEEIICDSYVFHKGEFPKFRWKNDLLVGNELGLFPLQTEYYNSSFQKVTAADKPGRYGAVIEGKTKDGFVIKRYVTLYCANVEFDDYSKATPIKINGLKGYGIPEEKWKKYAENENRFSFGSMKFYPKNDPDAAIFLAGLSETEVNDNSFNTPRVVDRQWWITLKNKLLNNSSYRKSLANPVKDVNRNSNIVLDSAVVNDGYSKLKLDKLKSLCAEWAEKGETANVTLVVHKGKVIFHEAFGKDSDGKPLTLNSNMWMASITKLLTGVLTMQFVEQGIIELDAPVEKYLPELKTDNENKLTVRQLYTHLSGLQFAGEWATDWNYSLENQVAQLIPSLQPGKVFSYNRVGYALAGKIIERITGKAVPYLFNEYVFSPLEMKSAYSENTYGGLYCTAYDLAKLGMMLINKGAYNGFRLFDEETFKQMLPAKLSVGDRYWGIGTTLFEGNGLSNEAFGHGAASGAVFRIDPKNDLILISARNKPGKFNSEFEKEFIKCCTDLINNK